MQKVSENETIEDIVKEMLNLGLLDEKSTDKIPRSLQALGLRTYAARIKAAHQREVAELKRQRKEALAIASDIDKCASIERHTDAMLKKNEVIVGLRKEVAELRECLVRRSSHLNAILQKALELRNDVPLELRKVMDECIIAEDKAIGFGVFSKEGVENEGK